MGRRRGCFFLKDLTGKTLTTTSPLDSTISCLAVEISSITSVSVNQFYFTVAGHVMDANMSLSRSGVQLDGTVSMRSRSKGGVKTEVPGSWTCMVCNMGGCWPARASCFRCRSSRGATSPTPPVREQRYPGKGGGNQGQGSG